MSYVVGGCLLAIGLCLAGVLWTVVAGERAVDRLLAFDLSGVLIAVALAIFSIMQQSWAYLETSMGVAVLAFVGTIALADYVRRGGVS